MSNEHQEQAREKEAERIVRYCGHASIPFQQKMGYVLDVLSSRDAEVREVLEGLITYRNPFCWCPPDTETEPHSEACRAATALYTKLQPKE